MGYVRSVSIIVQNMKLMHEKIYFRKQKCAMDHVQLANTTVEDISCHENISFTGNQGKLEYES